jgi:hypothetical protein
MGCAWRRARHKRHYGQCIDVTFAPQHSRDDLNPYLQGAQGKEVEQWRGIRSKSIAHSSTDRIPHSEFSLLTLIGTAFPQRNDVRTHLCLGSTEIAQWIVRGAVALSLQCTYVLIRRYSMFAITVVITSVRHRETWAHGKDDWVAKGVQEIEQGGTYLDGELYDLR